jgi:hypothetical protein
VAVYLENIPADTPGGLVQFLGFDPSALGLTGFVSLIIVSIVRGWLIPKATYIGVLTAKDAELERYKLALVAEEARGDIQDAVVKDLVASAKSTQHLVEQLHASLMRLSNTEVPPGYPPVPPTSDPPGGAS